MTRVDDSRRAAYDVLRAVAARDAYANLTLPKLLRERRISGRDAAFATELTYGALRMRGTLDAVIARATKRTVDDDVLDVLRLGAYQLLYLRVPAHAAVSTSVDLAPRRAAGFVNAVLRKVGARDLDSWLTSMSAGLVMRHAHPEWIVTAFRDALDGDLAETERALAADNAAAPVHLVARGDRDALAAEVGGRPTPWSPYGVVLDRGDPGALSAIRQGRAAVQDEGSQLVALALSRVRIDGRDERWLDACAGPGGKTAVLGSEAAERSAQVLAIEPRAHRAKLVRRAVGGYPVDVVRADSTTPAWSDRTFDRVLVDVPCSGLGALRRRPEARWRRQESDIDSLVQVQRALLTAALRATRLGGVVAYVTCSPHLAETRGIVGAAELLDAREYLPGVPHLGPGPTVQLWPHRHGTDAMFLALLRAER